MLLIESASAYSCCLCVFFLFNDTATTEIYTLSLHDALPICGVWRAGVQCFRLQLRPGHQPGELAAPGTGGGSDRLLRVPDMAKGAFGVVVAAFALWRLASAGELAACSQDQPGLSWRTDCQGAVAGS